MPRPLKPLHEVYILRQQIAQELVIARALKVSPEEMAQIKARWCMAERRYNRLLQEKLAEMQQ